MRVISSIVRGLIVATLCAAICLHWIVLQSVAWTSMVVKYSQGSSLYQAVEKTFDGNHPCSLCHAVLKGKNSEKKSDLRSFSSKFDLIAAVTTAAAVRSFQVCPRDFVSASFVARSLSPPVPPPRFATR